MPEPGRNPFPYGRELSAAELVDREEELAAIERTLRNREKLFLVGPRRYGKTSLLAAAAERARREGAVVLRFDAERYETLPLLARAVLTAAARALAGPLEKVTSLLRDAAARLRPEVSLDPATGEIAVRMGVEEADDLPVLTEALDAVERMAGTLDGPVAVMLDEVQQIVVEHGRAAERQLRSTVQTHRHVAYVFAGSDTRLLGEMTSEPRRPFYRLGARLFVQEIPEAAFRAHLASTFEASGMEVRPEGVEAILRLADQVPYNVQRLAHEVWERLRVEEDPVVSPPQVEAALADLLEKEDPAYTQIWTTLSVNQKKAVKAVMVSGGRGVLASSVARELDIPVSSLQAALKQGEDLHVLRRDVRGGDERHRLVDPFLAAWVRRSQSL